VKKFFSDKLLALIVIVVGTFMAILDSSIVNIAIPKMMAVFNASTDQIEWVLTSYMLTMAIILPMSGLLGERFGLKNVYVFALTVFTIGSLLCGVSWNLPTMIAARIIQALGGGMIMPVSMTLIYKIVPRQKIGIAMGFWGIAAMAAPAIGPTLGGYLIEYADWRLIFNVNIPIGILAIASSAVLLDGHKEKIKVHKFDYTGSILVAISIFTLILGLNDANRKGWGSPYIVFLFLTSALSIIAFVIVELNHSEPILDIRILKNSHFSLSLILSSITSIALFGGVFLIPIYLQSFMGLTAMQAGLLMLPASIATAIFMPVSGKLFDKYGAQGMILCGMTLLVCATFLLSRINLSTDLTYLTILLIFRGIGIGIAMMPISTYGMSTISNTQVGKASALSGTIRQLAGALGIALFSSVMSHQQSIHTARLSEALTLSNASGTLLTTESIQKALSFGLNLENARTVIYRLIGAMCIKQSFIMSMNDTFLIATIVALLGIFLGFFVVNTNNHSQTDSKANKVSLHE
jgi:EmrB/QacA subfamily drug resistance transporter